MRIGHHMNISFRIIEYDIETSQDIIAYQSTQVRIGRNIKSVFENIGRYIPETVRPELQLFDNRKIHPDLTADTFPVFWP